MKIHLRIVLFLILILFLVATFSLWYANKYILPVKARAFVVETLEKQLSRKVTLGNISYNPWRGVVLNDLTIFDQENPPDIFIRAKNINFNCFILPIFKEKKIIVPALNLRGVQINLRRKENGWWNSEDLFSLKPKAALKSNLQFFIYRISLEQGEVSVVDNYVSPPFSQDIENLEIISTFSLPSNINFKVSGRTREKTPSLFNLKGIYNLPAQSLSWQGNFKNINLSKYAPYYKEILPLTKNLEGTAEVVTSGSMDKNLGLNFSKEILLNNLSLATESFSASGGAKITASVSGNLKEIKNLKYNGRAEFSNFTVSQLPYIETISNIGGVVTFANDDISTQSLKGAIYNLPLNVSGNIRDFANLQADLSLTSDLDLSQLKQNLPEKLRRAFPDAEIKGEAMLSVFLKGSLRDNLLNNLDAHLVLKNSSIKAPLLPYPFDEINGDLSFKKYSLHFDEGSFSYQGLPYKLNGTLTNFTRPNIKFNLASEKLNLQGDLDLQHKDIHINQAQGKYLNYNFEVKGDIFDITKPRLNLYADAQFDLANLNDILPLAIKDFKADELAIWQVKGMCFNKIFVSGPAREPKDLEIGVKSNCSSLEIKKIKLANTTLDFRMKDRQVVSTFNAQPYQGNLNSEIEVDLNSKNPAYLAEINLNDIDLKLLIKDLDLKKKNISGYLSAQGNFHGFGTNLETLKGQAWVEVLEGNLWEIPLLGEFSNILNIPQLNKITFKQGHGNFTLTNKQIVTKDLVLLSKEMALSAQGSLDFERRIDITVSTSFDPEFLKRASFLGTIIAGFQTLVQYHIYNTLDQPKFEKIITPPTIPEGLPSDFLERLKSILKGNPQ